jgi:hypothetical protein
METVIAAHDAAVLIGRCVACKRPFRVEIPPEVVERFGARLAGAPGYALAAAGIGPIRCLCQDRGIRCPDRGDGIPKCGDWHCDGHGPSEVKFKRVKVEYKPEVQCSGSCWQAKSSKCTCSCRGKSHGGMWAS